MVKWQLMSARITLFPEKPGNRTAAQIYRDLWSEDPESFQSGQANVFGQASNASGKRGASTFTVSAQPIRIDLNFTVIPEPESRVQFLSADEILPKLERLAESVPLIPSRRIACYVQLGYAASDTISANAALSEAIDSRFRPKDLRDEEDFVLQVNSIADSKTLPEVKHNLLLKYSVEKLQTITLPGPALVHEQIISMIHMDFNNKPVERAFDDSQLKKLVRELCELAVARARVYLG
ncbi:hypothetical protein [Methylocystis rosea]|uniref:hypothetical protein n=1 Tax=Methylocystis rosea TaxID=173366 RepID=UPI0003757B93|nr:hypothetical protein [Methylocystis rosea]